MLTCVRHQAGPSKVDKHLLCMLHLATCTDGVCKQLVLRASHVNAYTVAMETNLKLFEVLEMSMLAGLHAGRYTSMT